MLRLARLFETVWRGGTYTRLAAILGLVLAGAVAVREAPVIRTIAPIRQISARQALAHQGRIILISGGQFVSEERESAGHGSPVATYVVEMTALSEDDWQLAPADLHLEFEGGASVAALPPDMARHETSLIFAPGVERTATVRFPLRGGPVNALPVSIRLHRPRARFMLESG